MEFSSETRLSEHFRLRELEKSQVALRNDIDNTVQDSFHHESRNLLI